MNDHFSDPIGGESARNVQIAPTRKLTTEEQIQAEIQSLATVYIHARPDVLRQEVSEVFALRWEHIDFKAGQMMVQQGVVNGRIGKVKTEASQDEVPLDPSFAAVLLRWKGDRSEGLVFPSHVTGGCFYSGIIQRQILKPKGGEIGIDGLGWHTFRHTYRSLLDETGAPIGVQQKLMRHANVSTTMNVYGNASLRAKQHANSRVVQMVMTQEKPQTGEESAA